MGSVYGFYASSASATSSKSTVGMSGLVSGLDTDSIVDAMCSGTNAKISKVQQNLMKLQWKQEAYQDVGEALTEFKSKYMSSSSATCISSLLTSCFKIDAQGDNAGAVTASGSTDILSNFSILGVNSLATTASFTSAGGVTTNAITSGKINFTESKTVSTLEGKNLNLKVGDDSFSLTFDNTLVTDSASMLTAVQNAINNCTTTTAAGKSLSDLVSASLDSEGNLVLTSSSTSNISVQSSSSSAVLDVLGYQKVNQTYEGGTSVSYYPNGTTITGKSHDFSSTTKEVSFGSTIGSGDKSFTLDLDGQKATVKFDSDLLDKINAAGKNADGTDKEEPDKSADMLTAMVDGINSQLSKVFGTKVEAVADTANGTFSLSTSDSNSVLSVASGSSDLTGTSGLLGIKVGAANRLLLSETLENSNFKNAFAFGSDGKRTYDLKINGVSFEIGKNSITIDGKTTDYKNGVTMKNVMSAINSSDANVKMSYLSTTDRFTISSTVSGAAGDISVSGSFADMILGTGVSAVDSNGKYISDRSGSLYETYTDESGVEKIANNAGGAFTKGHDAELLVSFDGNTIEKITRSTNSFKLDGLSINLSGTFNDDAESKAELEAARAAGGTTASSLIASYKSSKSSITFSSSVDSEKLIDAMKEMTEAYNGVISKVVEYYTTKNDSEYQPLTSDMIKEEDLTDEQAELYNDKAKEGMLFGDSILAKLLDDVRSVFTGLSSIGITTSSNYTEYGKISFDADKFKNALESDPDKVTNLFSNEKSGVFTKLDKIMSKYVDSSLANPGLITRKSGLKSSSLSQMNSTLYSEREAMEKQLSTLKDKLETQQDRYYKQFTNMETILNKLNNQSSYLAQL